MAPWPHQSWRIKEGIQSRGDQEGIQCVGNTGSSGRLYSAEPAETAERGGGSPLSGGGRGLSVTPAVRGVPTVLKPLKSLKAVKVHGVGFRAWFFLQSSKEGQTGNHDCQSESFFCDRPLQNPRRRHRSPSALPQAQPASCASACPPSARRIGIRLCASLPACSLAVPHTLRFLCEVRALLHLFTDCHLLLGYYPQVGRCFLLQHFLPP